MNIPLTPLRFLRYAEQQYPRRTAVVCNQNTYTYAQFADRASRLAGALCQAGVQPSDRVAFLSTNCHRLLEAYYGVLEAGAVLLPLNIRLAASELGYILKDCRRDRSLRGKAVSSAGRIVSQGHSMRYECSANWTAIRKHRGSPPQLRSLLAAAHLIAPISPPSTKTRWRNFFIPAARARTPKG